MRVSILFFIFSFAGSVINAQDSVRLLQQKIKTDSVSVQLNKLPVADSAVVNLTPASVRSYILTRLLRLKIKDAGVFVIQKEKANDQKDWLFYYIIALLLMFGVLKLSYIRYFNDLFRFFFRTSLRINQIREQLVQSGLQSLLFNVFFALSFGLYIYLLVNYYDASIQLNRLLLPFLATGCLVLLYGGKYLFLKISGWLFSISNATETYTFIIFLINKVAGIAIIPFLVLIAFAQEPLTAIAVTLSLILVVGLFMYRFLRAYQPVQAEVKVSRIHFFIFFLAIEIAPLLLIYKLLIRFF
jgi:hypothetical protein